jgi:hypothetical protein
MHLKKSLSNLWRLQMLNKDIQILEFLSDGSYETTIFKILIMKQVVLHPKVIVRLARLVMEKYSYK